jgi:hypothetical protein
LKVGNHVHPFFEIVFAKASAADEPVGVTGVAVAAEMVEHVQVIGRTRPNHIAPRHARGRDETVVEAVVDGQAS